jgi:hypothetical protein
MIKLYTGLSGRRFIHDTPFVSIVVFSNLCYHKFDSSDSTGFKMQDKSLQLKNSALADFLDHKTAKIDMLIVW